MRPGQLVAPTRTNVRLKPTPAPWHPDAFGNTDGLTLIHRRRAQDRQAAKDNEDILLDPSATASGGLSSCIQIFTDPAIPIPANPRRHIFSIPEEAVTVYTDGSALHNGCTNAQAGAGIFYGPNDPRTAARRLPNTAPAPRTKRLK
ncbi:hypothetical protein EIP86_008281 [Pleurotus ostreatoroseus]|nr:hypothetical protein EIP86_008281 [Pleurotus ostreatoroseus]